VGTSRERSQELPPDAACCRRIGVIVGRLSSRIASPAKPLHCQQRQRNNYLPPPSSPSPLSSGVRRSWVPSEPRDLQPVALLSLSAARKGVEDEEPAAESVLRLASVASRSVGSLESFRTDLQTTAAVAAV
jgi:hypothetical protein